MKKRILGLLVAAAMPGASSGAWAQHGPGDEPIYASQHGAQAVAHTTLVDSLDPVRGVVANVILTIDPGAISHEIG
ncbi:hypothetical protein SB379_01330 [Burkholderia multivorans]|uniref:hypothetical protein n=1 Tax=Burkholderia multivorans TaxID=87883 RepID=UPI000D3D51BF|nr:hypothetical protein [Burkholderia multivorans]MBR8017872.1 hypothetical protein [Burkholderia multivorans]MEB2509034.1 hypothetical protein [Burkholderia multivorans]MEB2520125.1 hypothetical protein [Burkholderia multivorans]MEB2572610.1 hypothetical protein [Burkholderia multivorans]MEB2590460.1 hypothetical protein [Burkholderia multivorans]